MMQAHDDQPIIAQCTPQGAGALALLRVSGQGAIQAVGCMSVLASGKKLEEQQSHTIHLGSIVSADGHLIDQVMFLLMRAPKTFTGQDTVEITCHNNPILIARIIQCAFAQGVRIADNGEFSRRAVIAGKIDLMQAEAINELLHAQTESALKRSLAQLEGSLSHFVTGLEKQLLMLLAYCNASFEFIEEEQVEFGDYIVTVLKQVIGQLQDLEQSYAQQHHVTQGVRIALIGAVNAGKSSLFNMLLGKNRAIVSEYAGTTRDVVEAVMHRAGVPWTLVDTAGLRVTHDSIEQQGIARSYDEAHAADLVLLVLDAARPLRDDERLVYEKIIAAYGNKTLIVLNKIDQALTQLPTLSVAAVCQVSTYKPETLAVLWQYVEQRITALLQQADSPFLLTQRQHHVLATLRTTLEQALHIMQQQRAYELVAYHLQDALAHLASMTGKSVSEQAMDAVFREFCVGK